MILGILDDKENRIYVKLNESKKTITFDFVNKNGIIHLNKNQIRNLLTGLFNTKKRYLETKDGYDTYLDENNLKRYYKDGKEDFNMFYLNNGIDATAYLGKGLKAAIKSFTFTVGALATTVLITTQGVDALQRYNEGNLNVELSVNIETDYFEPVTLEHLKSYIYSSEGLTDFDKELLYNEDYLSFVLSISDNERKLYDFNDRFRGINIKEYPIEELQADGYYSTGTNIIHILDKHVNDKEKRKSILPHEFVHLTQASSRYAYLDEALAEIMSYEFYNKPNDAYPKVVKRVKVLMEIIGPAPILNAVYSYDTTMLENAIRQYLNEEDTKDFLEMLRFNDWLNPDKTRENAVHEKITMYLTKMIDNKYEQSMEKYDKQWKNKTTIETRDRDYDKKLMTEILEGRAQYRMYFNKNKRCYYDDIYMRGEPYNYDERMECNDFKELLSLGNPESIEITNVSIPREKIIEYLKKPEFVNFINSVRDIDFLKSGKMEYAYYSSLIKNEFNRTSSKGYPTTFDNPEEYVNSGQYIKDILDIINNSGVDEIEISPSISSKKIILSIEDFEKLKPIFSENNAKVKINFKESNSTLDSASTTLGDLNNKSITAILHRSEYIRIPSIAEKFENQVEEYALTVNSEKNSKAK